MRTRLFQIVSKIFLASYSLLKRLLWALIFPFFVFGKGCWQLIQFICYPFIVTAKTLLRFWRWFAEKTSLYAWFFAFIQLLVGVFFVVWGGLFIVLAAIIGGLFLIGWLCVEGVKWIRESWETFLDYYDLFCDIVEDYYYTAREFWEEMPKWRKQKRKESRAFDLFDRFWDTITGAFVISIGTVFLWWLVWEYIWFPFYDGVSRDYKAFRRQEWLDYQKACYEERMAQRAAKAAAAAAEKK